MSRARRLCLTLSVTGLLLFGCTGDVERAGNAASPAAPSDDPADYSVSTSSPSSLTASAPRWVVPDDNLPSALVAQASNNNVDIHFFQGDLYLAWRTGPYHFADEAAQLLVMASSDGGESWRDVLVADHGADVREPRLYDIGGRLFLMYFEAGVEPTAFEPKEIWQRSMEPDGTWTSAERVFEEVEVPWDIKVRGGVAYMTSYIGGHYQDAQTDPLELRFRQSDNGHSWMPVGDEATVYVGGVSEAAFEFDVDGSLWALTRNEDCDQSGCGSHVCWAASSSLGTWECPAQSAPRRFDSPELFRHGDEIYVVARRNLGETFGPEGDLLTYSLSPKTTAVFRINKEERSLVHLMDLPGAGDTAFPSVRRTGSDTFLLANYTSPLDDPEISWLDGQISEKGTQIYLLDLSFEP